MSGDIGKPERETQRRVLSLFRDELNYRYLGDWSDREGNSNIDDKLVTDYLLSTGNYTQAQINAAIQKLTTEATNKSRGLYGNNKAVYNLLRYGVPVKVEAGRPTDTVHLINWGNPDENDFAIAEEVTLTGGLERRPDLVLYVNGIALGLVELKNSRVSVGEGIRQCLSNQRPEFNAWFFSTIQFVFAGNDSEGLRYGTIGTEEKYFLTWKEDEAENTRFKLDKYLLKMCEKGRFLELVHDFVLFLLKKDKKTSLEVFGSYIDTYKFSEAVEDNVVLDLVYEARDIDQRLVSEDKIDAWFDAKTAGLNDWQRDELRKKWGTLQNVLSSRSRMDRVVEDVIFDFATKPRLSSKRGTALLVASSIFEACRYFTLFNERSTGFRGKCGLITSYNPQTKDVTLEDTGANTETDKQFIYSTYAELLQDVDVDPRMTKTETYEERAKELFKKEPANMRLLIVVDKLLTGFNAASCTYLYIDKSMQDHALFQAICRTNRLDGEDKEFGYIVDYKDLFRKVENAIAVYTSELDHSAGGADPEVLLHDRLTKGRQRLDDAIESLALLCEPVEPPAGELEHIHYFCGNTEVPTDLEEREPRRVALYKGTAGLVRAYANLADELMEAGYTDEDVTRIKGLLDRYVKLRDMIRNAAGETLDLKPYEADMRHLIDTYIEADTARTISPFDGMSLIDLIVKTGIADAIAERLGGLGGNRDAIAETIENNVRRKIIREQMSDPAFYERMSRLLDEVIADRRSKAIAYEEYLRRIAEIVRTVDAGKTADTPACLDSPGKRAIHNVLSAASADGEARDSEEFVDLTIKIHEAIIRVRRDQWRGVQAKEEEIKDEIYKLLNHVDQVNELFTVILGQKEY